MTEKEPFNTELLEEARQRLNDPTVRLDEFNKRRSLVPESMRDWQLKLVVIQVLKEQIRLAELSFKRPTGPTQPAQDKK